MIKPKEEKISKKKSVNLYASDMALFEPSEGLEIDDQVRIKPTLVDNRCEYLFKLPSVGNEDWRADGHHWKQYGKVSIGDTGYGKKYSFNVRTNYDEYSKNFQKFVFTRDDSDLVLIRYTGDESIAQDLPHGNSIKEPKVGIDFHRHRPSLLEEIKKTDSKTPIKVYDEFMRKVAPKLLARHSVDTPRDIAVVRNAHQSVRRKNNFESDDTMYNIVEIAHETGFIVYYLLLPEAIVIAVHKGN